MPRPAVETAAKRPRAIRNIGAIRSKLRSKAARDMTHLGFGSGEPRGSGAVRLDKCLIAPSEHCIDQRFRLTAMRLRTGRSRPRKRGPLGAPLRRFDCRPRNSRNAGARRSKTRSNFARDMTHTFQFEPQGSGGVSYLNIAQIGATTLTVNGICTALRYEIMVMP
jgi:hypothetical protein